MGSEQQDARNEFPVVIVGAGPVGMMLALDLAQRGVRSALVEQSETTLWYPKGNTHNARTMEHYRRLDLANEVRATGLPAHHPTDVAYFTALNGYELHRLSMPSTAQKLHTVAGRATTDQVPEPLHRSNQMYVERLLFQHVKSTPAITCMFGHEFMEHTSTADGVGVTVRQVADGGARRLRASYLVGCDGPRSVIRRSLGIGYQGEDVRAETFMGGYTQSTHVRIPDLHRRIITRPAWQYWVLRPGGVSNFVSLDGADEFLFHTVQGDLSTVESIRALAHECIGEQVDIDVLASGQWLAGRALVADRYADDRVFLCGDSVHLFTPTGGFGMNTGIDDAANLAWKLAAAVHGWAGRNLLASYELERRPIGIRNTNAALGLAKNIGGLPLGAALDEQSTEGLQARQLAAEVVSGFGQEFSSLGIQLGARYGDSPLIIDDGSAPPTDRPEEYAPSACPGGRAPHVWLPDGRSLFDAFGPDFTLLRLVGSTTDVDSIVEAASARKVGLRVVDVPLDAARDLYEADLALVRPDQHVAWRGNVLPQPAELFDAITGVKEKQTV